jgi:uncharacterized membrane protein required for colicin V production
MSFAGAFCLPLHGAFLAAAKVDLDTWQAGFFLGAAVFVAFTVWHGWRLGVVRQIISIIALIAAYIIGYFGGGALGPLLARFVDFPERVLAVFGAVLLGFVVYLCIMLVGAIAFKKTAQQSVGIVRLGYGMAGAVFGGLYGLFLVWIAVLAIRLLGSVAESQIAAERQPRLVHSSSKPSPTPLPPPAAAGAVVRGLAHMKQSLEQGAAGAMVQQVDPIPGTLYSILHKLGMMVSDEKSVDRFLKYPGVKPLLAHPKIAALQNDPDITRDILNGNYLALLRNRQILSAANDTEIGELMRKFEFEKALDYALRGAEKDTAKAHR